MLGRGGGAGAGGGGPPPSVPFSMRDDGGGSGGGPGLAARYDAGGFSLEAVLGGGGGARPGTSATGGGGGASRPATGASRLGTAGGGGRAATAASAVGPSSGSPGGAGSYPVVVLTENRAREVGMAIVDLAAAHSIQLVQLADTPSYAGTLGLLQAVAPLEVVVPKSQADRVLFKKVRVTRECAGRGRHGQGLAWFGGCGVRHACGAGASTASLTSRHAPASPTSTPTAPLPPLTCRSPRTGAPTPTRCARRSAPSTAGEGSGVGGAVAATARGRTPSRGC